MKISLKVLSLGLFLVFSLLAGPQLHAQKRSSSKSSNVLKGKNAFILSGLKMSPEDQKAFIMLAEKNPEAFKVSVNSKRGSKSYGKLANSQLKMREVLKANKVEDEGGTSWTCNTVSTDVQCVTVNNVVQTAKLNSETRSQLSSLMRKYMR